MGQSNVLVTYILVQQVLDYWDLNYWDSHNTSKNLITAIFTGKFQYPCPNNQGLTIL